MEKESNLVTELKEGCRSLAGFVLCTSIALTLTSIPVYYLDRYISYHPKESIATVEYVAENLGYLYEK